MEIATSIIMLIIYCAFWMIPLLLIMAVGIAVYIIEGIALYKIANKVGKTNAWLVWIPVFSHYFRTYLLCDLPGNKTWELDVLGKKWTTKERITSFAIYIVIAVLAPTVVGILMMILFWFPPAYLLSYVPTVAIGFMQYVYLKDVFDMFDENQESNKNRAMLAAVLDNVITMGVTRAIILYKVSKKDLLTKSPEQEAARLEGDII